jgi:hypothetical protein
MSRLEDIQVLNLKAGEFVEVRSREEILSTLSDDATFDGLPFMPEMFRFCGARFPVYKRAHKTCDTVNPVQSRRMSNAVHLETRCDGAAHGGCQAGCLIFWKEAWLKRVESMSPPSSKTDSIRVLGAGANNVKSTCPEESVYKSTRAGNEDGVDSPYSCQATMLPSATTELKWWHVSQYFEDYFSGNVGLITMVKGMLYSLLFSAGQLRWIGWQVSKMYELVHPLWNGIPWPKRNGVIATDKPTPTASLELKPGELVRVKPYHEILKTLNRRNKNRGMLFDKEMVPYCGGEYRVLKRISRIINEKTGELQEMKNQCIVLDSVVCESRYSECRLFCPRSIYPYWREVWLERVHEPAAIPSTQTVRAQSVQTAHSGLVLTK